MALAAWRGSTRSARLHSHPAARATNASTPLAVGAGLRRLFGTTGRESGADPHTVLGVAPGASLDAIKEAYRRCALRWHPDRAPANGTDAAADEANRKFRLATEAFAVLRLGAGGTDTPRHPAATTATARGGGARGGPGTRLGGRGQGGYRGSPSAVASPLTDHEARRIFDEINAVFGTRRRDTRGGSFRPGMTLAGMIIAEPTLRAGNPDDAAASDDDGDDGDGADGKAG